MNMAIVDYAGLNAGQTDSDIGKLICKFVILEKSGSLSLVMGPVTRFRYHAGLLDHYCREHGIPASWAKKPDLVEIHDSSVVLHGGGWMEVDMDSAKARLYGASTAYGPYRSDLARRIIADHPHFARFRVTYSR